MNLSSQLQWSEYTNASQMDAESLKNDDMDILYKIIPVLLRPTFLPAHSAFIDTSSYSISTEGENHPSSWEERIHSPSSHATADSTSTSPSQGTVSCGVRNVSSSPMGQVSSRQEMSKDTNLARPLNGALLNKSLKSFELENSPVSKTLFTKTVRSHNSSSSCLLSACMPRVSLPKPSKLAMLASLVLVILSLQPELSAARSVGVCRGIPCANGGRLLVSNSIWGNCRCRCPSGFVGPYCQYRAANKRSGDSAPGQQEAGSRISRSQTMELIRQHLLTLSQMEAPSSSGTTSDQNETESDDIDEIIIDNISRRDVDFELQALSKLADLSLIDRLDDDEALELDRKPSRQHRVWRAKRLASKTPWYRR